MSSGTIREVRKVLPDEDFMPVIREKRELREIRRRARRCNRDERCRTSLAYKAGKAQQVE